MKGLGQIQFEYCSEHATFDMPRQGQWHQQSYLFHDVGRRDEQELVWVEQTALPDSVSSECRSRLRSDLGGRLVASEADVEEGWIIGVPIFCGAPTGLELT